MDLLTAGSIAMDMVLNADALPSHDGFALIQSESLQPGGSSANVTVAATSLGVKGHQVGRVGDDEMGRLFRASLRESGVDERHLLEKAGGTTMHTYVITVPGGQHVIFAHMGDCFLDFTVDDLPEDIFEGIDLFYTDLFAPELSMGLLRRAFDLGKSIVVNLQSPPSFMEACGLAGCDLREALGKANLLVGGKEAMGELASEGSKGDYPAIADQVRTSFGIVDGVICTLGAEGALWSSAEGCVHAPSYPIEPLDTTGAGDCFIGGVLYSYYQEAFSRAEALDFANAAAALKCLSPGPRCELDVESIRGFKNSRL